jgi:hypothetical protein
MYAISLQGIMPQLLVVCCLSHKTKLKDTTLTIFFFEKENEWHTNAPVLYSNPTISTLFNQQDAFAFTVASTLAESSGRQMAHAKQTRFRGLSEGKYVSAGGLSQKSHKETRSGLHTICWCWTDGRLGWSSSSGGV